MSRLVSMTVPQMRRRQCTISLRPSETQLLSALLVNSPDRFVSMNELIEAIWTNPDEEPEDVQGCVQQWLMTLRKTGIQIENDWGRGWRIPARARGA